MTDKTCPLNTEGECRCGYEEDFIGCIKVRATYDSTRVVTADEALFRLLARERAREDRWREERRNSLSREDD